MNMEINKGTFCETMQLYYDWDYNSAELIYDHLEELQENTGLTIPNFNTIDICYREHTKEHIADWAGIELPDDPTDDDIIEALNNSNQPFIAMNDDLVVYQINNW